MSCCGFRIVTRLISGDVSEKIAATADEAVSKLTLRCGLLGCPIRNDGFVAAIPGNPHTSLNSIKEITEALKAEKVVSIVNTLAGTGRSGLPNLYAITAEPIFA